MTAALAVARERIVRAREHLIASRLGRFAWRHREAVAALTRRHPRLADLALSFPALLFALAVPRRRFDPEPVIERAIAGAPLSELAAHAGIPMWTRKLGPEAFLYRIPPLPDGEMFRRQIANHLPACPKQAHDWLCAVSDAWVWGHEAMAIWFARHLGAKTEAYALRHWRLICLWAWHASHPEALASKYLSAQWTPDMTPRNALAAARDWTTSVAAAVEMGEAHIADAWAETTMLDGYVFEPILSASGLIEQSRAMHNCARSYGYGLGSNTRRLWMIRKDGKHVGMVALEADPVGYPLLGEASGPNNSPVAPEVALAAHRWYRTCVALRAHEDTGARSVEDGNWRGMWRGYWLAKRRVPPWLGLKRDWEQWSRLTDADRDRAVRIRRHQRRRR